jgi:protein-disulfide isomerase
MKTNAGFAAVIAGACMLLVNAAVCQAFAQGSTQPSSQRSSSSQQSGTSVTSRPASSAPVSAPAPVPAPRSTSGEAPEQRATSASTQPSTKPVGQSSSQPVESGAAELPLPVIEPMPETSASSVDKSKPTRAPVLSWLESQGVVLTALGEEGGLHAYLGEAPGGRMQVFYLTPDGQHIVAGMMFREGGSNVTAAQLAAMRERFIAERRRIQEQEGRMATAQQALGGGLEQALTPAPQRSPVPSPSETRSGQSEERVALRDRIIRAAESTAWFSLGREGAPVVYMLADPQCPHCHNVWAQLRPRIEAGEIMVKIILVGALPGSEERAISILSRPEPGRAWLAGEGSTNARVAPPPPENSRQFQMAQRLLRANLEFAREVGIKGTPWLAYVGRDGELRTVEGETDTGVFLRNIR